MTQRVPAALPETAPRHNSCRFVSILGGLYRGYVPELAFRERVRLDEVAAAKPGVPCSLGGGRKIRHLVEAHGAASLQLQ